ncbi:Ig-like domain-containing protein [Corynebacterium camporealensis]
MGEIGKPITAILNYSQAELVPPIDHASVTFVDVNDEGEFTYPDTPVRTLEVENEGTWTIQDNGAITFTPEEGFAGHPTPVTYSAKDEDGGITADDPDTEGAADYATVTYRYTSAFGT